MLSATEQADGMKTKECRQTGKREGEREEGGKQNRWIQVEMNEWIHLIEAHYPFSP